MCQKGRSSALCFHCSASRNLRLLFRFMPTFPCYVLVLVRFYEDVCSRFFACQAENCSRTTEFNTQTQASEKQFHPHGRPGHLPFSHLVSPRMSSHKRPKLAEADFDPTMAEVRSSRDGFHQNFLPRLLANLRYPPLYCHLST